MVRTHKLVERLQAELQQLWDGTAPSSLGLPSEAARPGYQALMERLAVQWRGERRARSVRVQFHPRAEVSLGWREIWRLLQAGPPDYTLPPDLTLQERPVRPSEWTILNESARGFALRSLSGALPSIGVGEIVALRRRDGGALYIGVVRWILSNNPEHFELGLQQLAPTFMPAVCKAVVDERATAEPVLFFPEVPAQRRPPVIATRPNLLRAEDEVTVRHRLGRRSFRVARTVEKLPRAELIELVALPAAN